jgi:hypothetical protein
MSRKTPRKIRTAEKAKPTPPSLPGGGISADGTLDTVELVLMALLHRHGFVPDLDGGRCKCGHLCDAGINHLRHVARALTNAGVTVDLTAVPDAVEVV